MPVSATYQHCQSVTPISASQCRLSVPVSVPPISARQCCLSVPPNSASAAYQCQSVPPISAISASSSVPISATYQCLSVQ
ncbi:unnamed protein product, partial [Staurois parvus]